jgi:hypothetical protein
MNISEFTSLIEFPNNVSLKQTNDIDEIIESYPYFQAARMIQLKGLKNHQSFKYNNFLKKTAAYTTNRTILFDYITSDTLDLNSNLKKEQHLIENSNIVDLEIVEKTTAPETSIISADKKDDLKIIEQQLDIGKPLIFDLSEMHSFYKWLQLTSFKPIERKDAIKDKSQKIKAEKFELIEQFIKTNPKIKPSDSEDLLNVNIEGNTENQSLMTETLARVYLEQKQYKKAIQAFRILSLKYPEKSGFFADRIKAIKFLQKNNN